MSRPSPSLAWIAAVVCALSGCASGEEQAPPPVATLAMTPEQEQAMEDYLESQAPGEHHSHLEPLIGHFNATVLHWQAPGGPAVESTGVLDNTWALGGRFVLMQFHGEELGQPFEGMGLLGYDTVKQKHVGNWADSMGTFLWPTATGECSDGGDVITLSRVMTDPAAGGLVKIRDVTTIVDHDHITYEMFATHPGSDEFKILEAHYVRA